MIVLPSRPELPGLLMFRADLMWSDGAIVLNMADGIALSDPDVELITRQERARAAVGALEIAGDVCSRLLRAQPVPHPGWLSLLYCPPDGEAATPQVQIGARGALLFANWKAAVGQSVCDIVLHWDDNDVIGQFRVSPNLPEGLLAATAKSLRHVVGAFTDHLDGKETSALARTLIEADQDIETVIEIPIEVIRSTVEQRQA